MRSQPAPASDPPLLCPRAVAAVTNNCLTGNCLTSCSASIAPPPLSRQQIMDRVFEENGAYPVTVRARSNRPDFLTRASLPPMASMQSAVRRHSGRGVGAAAGAAAAALGC